MVIKTLKELLDGQDWPKLNSLAEALYRSEITKAQKIMDSLKAERSKGKSSAKSIIKDALGYDSSESDYISGNPLTVYIAGPYTPYDASPHSAPKVAHENVVRAIDFGIDVADRGHFPYIPHYSHFMHIYGKKEMPYEFYTEQDFKWLEKCDAIFYYNDKIGAMKIGGKRGLAGAERELQEAIKQRKLVFFSVEEIPKYIEVKEPRGFISWFSLEL